jgi:predicted permease
VSVPRDQVPAPDGAPPPFVVAPRILLERLAVVPGVASAALSSDRPLAGGGSAIFYGAEGDTTSDAQTRPRAYVHRVTPAFFETLDMRVLHGRTFLESELSADSTSVIVSEGVTRRFWPKEDPVGKRIKPGGVAANGPWLTIVGVVPEVRYRSLPQNPTADPDLYFPYVERGVQGVLLRTTVDPASVTGAVRAAIRELDRNIVVFGVSPMATLAAGFTAQSQFMTWVMGVFAAAALLLSAVGIYGVMAYLVTQRRREFGIRLALGAAGRDILGVVLGHGLRLVVVGLVLGIAAAAALSRLLEALLFGVTTTDPASAMAVALLAAVAVLACLVPALRATRVDPVIALRAD